MAPGIQESQASLPSRPAPASLKGTNTYPAPLKLSGALDKFSFEDTTPAIGREFHNVNIVDDLLNVANSDELIRDLAITSTDPKSTFFTIYIKADYLVQQFLNGELSFSEPRTTSTMTCRRNLYIA